MSRKRTRRVPRAVHNPFLVARNHATRLTAAERATVMTPLRAAADRMRRGQASDNDWAVLTGSLLMAQSIEKQGVVRGLAGHLDGVDRALVAIEARATRAGPWRSPTLHFHELDAIHLLLDLYQFQLEQLSYGEFRRAYEATEARVRSSGGQLVRPSEVAAC